MPQRLDGSAAAEWRDHWPVVLASMFGIGLQATYTYSTGVMIAPLEEEFGWPRAQISMGPLIVALSGAIVAPFIGMAIDRFGARRIAMAGVLGVCAAFALLSRAGPGIWSWWALWIVFAFAHPLVKPTVWTAAISSLFTSGRGMALAVAFCGTALSSGLVPIMLTYLIAEYGWRTAYVGLGGVWAIFAVPLIFLLFYSAVDKQRVGRVKGEAVKERPVLPGLNPREAFRSPAFIKLASATGLISGATIAMTANFVPIFTDAGIPRTTAAALAGILGLTGIVGKLSGGFLIDRFDAGKVVGFALMFPALACFLLIMMPGSVPIAALAVALFGLALGIEFDGVAYLASRHFGLRHFGLVFGTLAGLLALSSGLGPVLANYSYDLTKSYLTLLWTVIPLAIGSAVLFAIMGPYPTFATPPEVRAEPA